MGLIPAGCTVDRALEWYSDHYENQLMQAFFWPYMGADEAFTKQFKVLQHMIWREQRKVIREGMQKS